MKPSMEMPAGVVLSDIEPNDIIVVDGFDISVPHAVGVILCPSKTSPDCYDVMWLHLTEPDESTVLPETIPFIIQYCSLLGKIDEAGRVTSVWYEYYGYFGETKTTREIYHIETLEACCHHLGNIKEYL